MKNLAILLISVASFCLFSCVDEFDNTTKTPGTPDPPRIVVHSNLTGYVLQEDRVPLQGATVHVGEESMTTNSFGYFQFKNIPMDGDGQVIRIVKESFFDQYSIVYPELEKDPFIATLLLKESVVGSVDASQGGQIDGNMLKLKFDANSIVDAQQQEYTGLVQVYQAPINPDDEDFNLIVPGNLRTINEDGEDAILQSFGMSVIHLKGQNGESLNLKEGSTAELTFEIPETHTAEAPATIPMWYLDESTGYWIEEGEAISNGSEYVGNVSHFSFWNCDIGRLSYRLSFRLVTAEGLPIRNALVRLNTSTGLVSGTDYTDGDGYVSGIVPGHIPLFLSVNAIDDNCVWSAPTSLGSITSDDFLGNVVWEGESDMVHRIKTRIVDCAGSPIANAKFTLNAGNYSESISDADGNIDFLITKCSSAEAQFQVTDQNTGISSSIQVFTLSTGMTTNLGNFWHCPETPKIRNWGSAGSFETGNITASYTGEVTNWGYSVLRIEAVEGNASVTFDLEIFQKSDDLRSEVISGGYIDCQATLLAIGCESSGGGCGTIYMEDGMRGEIGEVISGFFYYDVDPNDNAIELHFTVMISE